MAETLPPTAEATTQETAPATQTATQDESPGIIRELEDTIRSLTSIKDKQEEFKTKDENDPEKKKIEDDLIKIMNDFNQTIEDLFINLNLNTKRLDHEITPSPLKTGKGVEEQKKQQEGDAQPKEDAQPEVGAQPEGGAVEQAAVMGGYKSKTQKKQSKNKNKNKTQKKKH
jgi:hypothetical protein